MKNQSPLTEAEEIKRGKILVSMLNLKEAKQSDFNRKRQTPYDPPRYYTEQGTKTALGVFRIVERIVLDGE